MPINIESMIKSYFEAWNSRDVNKIASFFTEDGVYENVALSATMHGKEELKDFLRTRVPTLQYFRLELKSFFHSGNRVALEWILTSTTVGSPPSTGTNSLPPATGTRVSIRGTSLVELYKGKIKQNCVYEISPVPNLQTPIKRTGH